MDNEFDLIQTDQWIPAKPKAIKGRGAASNIIGRFEVQQSEKVDDGWHQEEGTDIHIKTQVHEEIAKSILTHNQSPDLPFSVSLNPYRGCEHGCIYCFARPTHAYLGLSPGLDFETQLFAKTNAVELLRQELAQKNHQVSPIAFGVNTDAYQPCERELRLTRGLLEVLHECQHPVGLITKSSLIERDIDLISDMAKKNLAIVAITITTLDHQISRQLEPRAASPTRRMQVIRRLADAGIPVSVSVAPIIPFVTEQELENVLKSAVDAGARAAGYTILRLPHEVNPLFQEWLNTHFPERAQRVMNRIRDMRNGKDYHAEFGSRMRGEGVWADLMRQRFLKTLKRLGIIHHGRFADLDCTIFRKPEFIPPRRKDEEQLDLFG